jgi:RNA recognition motif-containing protein
MPFEVCPKEIRVSTNIYVGNLPFSATSETIEDLFSTYGAVESVNLIKDRETGRLRGFGFVEMASGANEAIAALHDKDIDGRNIRVNLAKPREERRSSRW